MKLPLKNELKSADRSGVKLGKKEDLIEILDN